MNKIELRHVLPSVFANRNDILSDVWLKDVALEKGRFYLVEANSGTGKSSLCSFIYGYRQDYLGEIRFDGAACRSFTTTQWVELRRRHIAMLWQDLRLFPELTAWENVQVKNRLTGFQAARQLDEWFEQLGIADKKDAPIGRMSFGQQQRVALVRTLCQPFDFMFADEPISHLDEQNAEIMGRIITAEARRQGAAVITTSIGKHIDLGYDQVLRL